MIKEHISEKLQQDVQTELDKFCKLYAKTCGGQGERFIFYPEFDKVKGGWQMEISCNVEIYQSAKEYDHGEPEYVEWWEPVIDYFTTPADNKIYPTFNDMLSDFTPRLQELYEAAEEELGRIQDID